MNANTARLMGWMLALVVSTLLASNSGCALTSPGRRILPARLGGSDKPTVDNSTVTAQWCWATAEQMERDGDDRQALFLYQQARSLAPQAYDYASRLCRLYDRLDQDQAALHEYQAALARHPQDAGLLNDLGMFYQRRDRWAEAEKWFRQALQAAPDHDRAAINLAISLGMQDRRADSYEVFAGVVGPAAAHSNLGMLLKRQGRSELARDHLDHALRLDPSLQAARQSLASLEALPPLDHDPSALRSVQQASYQPSSP